jgi:hypothetical protein
MDHDFFLSDIKYLCQNQGHKDFLLLSSRGFMALNLKVGSSLGTMTQACNPSYWEVENGRIKVQGQPGNISQDPSQSVAGFGGKCLSFQLHEEG